MAVVHPTTLTPTKSELLTSWLPDRPWYLGKAGEPELTRVGGFRLDDPEGEVGIEFIVVTDTAEQVSAEGGPSDGPVTYLTPLTYRGAPLEGAGHALIGTTEHGVLGRRWVYDGVHDPVLAAQLTALLLGEAVPQHQDESDTPDPTVTSAFTGDGLASTTPPTAVTDGPRTTDLLVRTAAAPGQVNIRLHRVLTPAADPSAPTPQDLGHVTAGWLQPDGTSVRAPFVTVCGAGTPE